MPNFFDWRGVRYLLPDDCSAKYIILSGGPNGSDVRVLNRKVHEDGTPYASECYVPIANGSLTVEMAEQIFGPDTAIAEWTDLRIPNPRIGM